MTPLMRSAFSHDIETRCRLADFVRIADRLSMGPKVAEFEREFSATVGRRFGVMTNSGGSANLLLLQALMTAGVLKSGDTIGVSAVTWATNVMPILQLGMNARPMDVNVETLNMATCVEDIGLAAIFATNALGFCPDLTAMESGPATLIVDSCEGVGGELDGRSIGEFGAASTFSFFIGHHLSTIEGGMVCTNDPELDDILRLTRANGWDRDVSDEMMRSLRAENDVDHFHAKYTFYAPAFNVRPTEIQGFLGLEQLKYLEENCDTRGDIYERLSASQGFGIKVKHRMNRISPLAYPVVCHDAGEAYVRRRTFERSGVEVRPLISGNIARQPFFPQSVWAEDAQLPGADHLSKCAFYCGLHPEMTEDELRTIEECLS